MKKVIFSVGLLLPLLLSSCGESETEKMAKEQKEQDKLMDRVFHKITPTGNSPRF